jgi:hypothetical protein
MAKKKNASATDETAADVARRPGRPSEYRPFHGEMLLAYAARARASVEEIETCKTRDGIRHIQKPIAPPSITGFAAAIGVSRQTVWRWGEQHLEFAEALEIAKTAFEDIAMRMAALNAWSASVAALLLKNQHGWTDKAQLDVNGGVHLHFDAQDELT